MTQVTINDKVLLIVPVPEGQSYFDIYGDENQQEIRYNAMATPGKFKSVSIKLPLGNWQLIGKGNEIDETVWKGIVEMVSIEYAGLLLSYPDYTKETVGFSWADRSGHSLIRSHGMEPEKCVLLQLKVL